MNKTINDFSYRRLPATDGIELDVAVGGSGSPVVLLHGFPQTNLMWRHVAAELATAHTVICPDLRGYGRSDKPEDRDGETYSKRAMAADAVAVANSLGHDHFAIVGHDRGALVAFRAGLDHPDAVTHLGIIDVLPTLDMWDVLKGTMGIVGFHLYLMAQQPGLPEKMIGADPDLFFGYFLDEWTQDAAAIPSEVRQQYLAASRSAIPSIVADYRASAFVDVRHDEIDRASGNTLAMPVTVLQKDWGHVLPYDAAALWSAWTTDLNHEFFDAGHFVAEEQPDIVVDAVRALLKR